MTCLVFTLDRNPLLTFELITAHGSLWFEIDIMFSSQRVPRETIAKSVSARLLTHTQQKSQCLTYWWQDSPDTELTPLWTHKPEENKRHENIIHFRKYLILRFTESNSHSSMKILPLKKTQNKKKNTEVKLFAQSYRGVVSNVTLVICHTKFLKKKTIAFLFHLCYWTKKSWQTVWGILCVCCAKLLTRWCAVLFSIGPNLHLISVVAVNVKVLQQPATLPPLAIFSWETGDAITCETHRKNIVINDGEIYQLIWVAKDMTNCNIWHKPSK